MAYLPQASANAVNASNNKISNNYSFNASGQAVTVKDSDLLKILLVINLTDNLTIYNPLDSGLGGTITGCSILLDYDTTSMSNTDDLLVVYSAYIEDDEIVLLNEILNELRTNNKLLRKIYS